ncbi:MAG: hypothetical protein AWM53_00744 [Candidatus Dichloromethanomonas elyunquensis]|nr:MAG: hypothetical protein AWM53_00744 [Candidatus Dichloromethanomonas elyunquensis]
MRRENISAVERKVETMCECNCNCQNPELRPASGKCSEEQIKECHGDEKEHPCECEKK